MPSNKLAYKPNTNRLRLPDTQPEGTRCVKVHIPDDIEYIGYLLGALGKLGLQVYYDRDDNHTAKDIAALWKSANQKTFATLADGCECDIDCPPVGGGVTLQCDLPDCIDWDSANNVLDIFLEECDMTINIYQGCGCGGSCGCGGNNETFGGGQSAGGGGSGGSWTSEGTEGGQQSVQYGITQCDFITTTIPLILQSASELLQYIDDNAENLDGLIDGLSSAVGAIPVIGDIGGGGMQWITTVINAGSSAVLTMIKDQDFEYKVMEAWARAHGSEGNITTITRQDLLDIVQYLPNTWLGASSIIFPKIIMGGIFRVLNMDKVLSRLILATDTANEQLCNYIFAGAGLTYTPSPAQGDFDVPFPTETEILADGYDWAVSFDLRDAPFIENTQFELYVLGGVPLGEWIEGVGYKAVPDAPETPHSSTLLRMDFTQGTGGDVTKIWLDYEYVPLLEDATSRVQSIIGTSYDVDTVWNGIREQEITGWTSGTRYIELKPYRVLNDPSADGGTAIIRRIAFAGTLGNPLNLLAQNLS